MEDRKELKELGARIKRHREAMELSQEEFAQKCGLSKNYIGMLERGERNPSYLTLVQIAKRSNIFIVELVADPF